MADRKVYVNINNEQDLLTLLGSHIVPEFGNLGIRVEALFLAGEEDGSLRTVLARHGVGLKYLPYTRTPRCRWLAHQISRLGHLRFFARSGRTTTLYVKSRIRWRGGEQNMRRYWGTKAVGILAQFFRFLDPLIIRFFALSMQKLEPLDAPVICLDYIHNDFHIELWSLNRAQGKPYLAYVSNLDQVTNYPPHLDIPDYILVWGAFHESVMTKRYGLPAHRVRRVGFCRSDKLAGISAPDPGSLRVVYFCGNDLSNDPDFARNLQALLGALEGNRLPYVLVLKKHPAMDGEELWRRILATVDAIPLRHGRVETVASTWNKYHKVRSQSLGDKDFSYRDLRQLLEKATHAFSSTSTTTLEAAIAGVKSYFINLDHAVDGCFRFEHLRALVDSGAIPMVTDEGQLGEILRDRSPGKLGKNDVVARVRDASRTLATEVRDLLFPDGARAATAAPVAAARLPA